MNVSNEANTMVGTNAEQTEKKSEQQLLEELLKNSKKQLFNARVRTLASLVMAAVVVIAAVVLVPSGLKTIQKANDIIVQASATITLADTAITSITEMSTSITDMGDSMDTFITDNSETVTAVMTNMESIDFEGLNDAIKDLGDVIEPLANFFNKFN